MNLLFVASVVVVVYCAVTLKSPTRRCPACRSDGPRSRGVCKRCRGTGRVRRFGATAIHRFYWSAVGAALKGRMQEKAEKAKEKAGYPE